METLSNSHEDSIERADLMSDKLHSRKSSNYRDNYHSGSNSKHHDQKFQNSAFTNSFETNDPHPYLNGSQTHDESGEYSQEHSKYIKENRRNLSELEAVPERSLEHSDINKMSYMDSEARKWVFDQGEGSDDVRGSKGTLNLAKTAKESDYDHYHHHHHDSRGGYLAANGHQSHEKIGLNTFTSPRFQVQSSGKKRSKSRSRSRERNEQNREDTSKKISQRNYNNLYNDTFSRRNFEQKSVNSRGGGGEDSHGKENYQVRHSTPSEPNYAHSMKNYLGRFSHKVSPRNRQNLSAYEFQVNNERVSDRSEQRRLNKTEFVSPYSRDDSFQIQESADAAKMIQIEREKNDKLEEKILSKEKLLKRMKDFHDQLYQEHLLTKNELERVCEERDNLEQEIGHQNSQKNKLGERMKELEVRLRSLGEENERLLKSDAQKGEMIKELEDRLSSANLNIEVMSKKYEGKVESLNSKLNRVTRENKEILQQRDQVSEKLEDFMRYKASSDDEVRALKKRNDELMSEVESLRRQNHERSRVYRDKDDSISESRKALEERTNHSRVESSPSSQELIAKYKHKIAKLEANNEHLKLELQSRPSMRRFKENENKLHSLENELEGAKNHGHEHRKSTEINFTGKILRDIINELEIENIGDIVPRIKEIQETGKANAKFVNCVLDLVARCSPSEQFEGKPTPKQAWKWIKRLMEEYMNMKKEGRETEEGGPDSETLRLIMDYLMIEDPSEISVKLRNVLVDNNLMKRVISKVKSIHNLEWVNSLQDLERRLENPANPRHSSNGSDLRPRYSQMNSN